MLISKPISQGEVIDIKLITGEEIISKVVDISEESITIQKPMQLSIGMDDRTKQVGIQMVPYFLLCSDHDAKLTIKNIHIIVSALANEQAKAGYIQNTTGLKVATSTNGLIK